MQTVSTNRSAPSRLARVGFATAALTLTLLAGCDKHPEGDGHGHPPAAQPAAKTDTHAGHDHGAGGGAGEGEDAHADEVKLTTEAIERYGIKVEPAQTWILKPTFITPARVGFNTEAMAHVGAPLRGRAVEIKVRLGDAVKKGDALVVIESPELGEAQADYFQKRTAVQSASPGVELAKVAWERAKGLYEQSQGISLTEVQRREAEYKGAIANQKAAESAVIGSENRLHLLGMSQAALAALSVTGEIAPKYTITAAIDGQVVLREITLGELVSPDRESVMVLADTSTLWVLADVPEAQLAEVAVGSRAWVTIGTVGSKRFEGQVAFVAPLVDPTTRTAQVRIEVPSATLSLKPGMFAQVEIVATAIDAQASGGAGGAGVDPAPMVAVPDEAVQTVEGGPAVFVPVKGEPNTFAKRAVTVGKSVGGLVPIYAGLVEGEEFVSAGTFILKADLGKAGAAHEH
ncbi:hypothetical protein BH11PLA1_BH11PLA1_00610 [soil metagenome]